MSNFKSFSNWTTSIKFKAKKHFSQIKSILNTFQKIKIVLNFEFDKLYTTKLLLAKNMALRERYIDGSRAVIV